MSIGKTLQAAANCKHCAACSSEADWQDIRNTFLDNLNEAMFLLVEYGDEEEVSQIAVMTKFLIGLVARCLECNRSKGGLSSEIEKKILPRALGMSRGVKKPAKSISGGRQGLHIVKPPPQD